MLELFITANGKEGAKKLANQKILDKKQTIIDEIAEKTKNAKAMVLFEYQGLTVSETDELRKALKETDSEFKIYKNTLVKRAFDTLKIDFNDDLKGPKAMAFGTDAIAPIKVLYDFAKKHPALIVKAGLVDGEKTDEVKLSELSKLPSRDGLLTMLASGLIYPLKNLSICLDLYRQDLEKNN